MDIQFEQSHTVFSHFPCCIFTFYTYICLFYAFFFNSHGQIIFLSFLHVQFQSIMWNVCHFSIWKISYFEEFCWRRLGVWHFHISTVKPRKAHHFYITVKSECIWRPRLSSVVGVVNELTGMVSSFTPTRLFFLPVLPNNQKDLE